MRRRTARLWLPVGVWMAVIFVLSSFPSLPKPPGLFGIDKLQHFAAYAILAALALRAVRGARAGWSPLAAAMAAVLIAAAYGAADEFHQSFVPCRSCDFFDWTADLLGAVIGAALVSAALRFRDKRMSNVRGRCACGGEIDGERGRERERI